MGTASRGVGFRGILLLLGSSEQGTVGLSQLSAQGTVDGYCPQETQWLHQQDGGLCVTSPSQVSIKCISLMQRILQLKP